jgi:hypothetical protein
MQVSQTFALNPAISSFLISWGLIVAGDEDDRLARNVGSEMGDTLDFFEFARKTELVGDFVE